MALLPSLSLHTTCSAMEGTFTHTQKKRWNRKCAEWNNIASNLHACSRKRSQIAANIVTSLGAMQISEVDIFNTALLQNQMHIFLQEALPLAAACSTFCSRLIFISILPILSCHTGAGVSATVHIKHGCTAKSYQIICQCSEGNSQAVWKMHILWLTSLAQVKDAWHTIRLI